jgi:integrase/recombinase XerD
LRSFFHYLAKERSVLYAAAASSQLPREPVRLPVDGFTADEIEQVMAVPDVHDPIGLRNRGILEVLYSTGIRRMEVANLALWDVDYERGCVTVRAGKGARDRVVPIGVRALVWVRRYIEASRGQLVLHPDEWALFISNRGTCFSSGGLGNEVAKIIKRSGVRERLGSCHLFRHSLATTMLENGADVRYVQEMLGHARLTTTQIYTKVSIEKLKEIHTATHPSAKLGRGDDAREANGTTDPLD